MKPYCRRCGFELDSSDAPCKECESEILKLTRPIVKPTCPDCGDPIEPGRTLCDFCLAKAAQPQSYPPSIVPDALNYMQTLLIDSILIRVEAIESQAAAVKTLLRNLKGRGN